jgi:hypothetical protein
MQTLNVSSIITRISLWTVSYAVAFVALSNIVGLPSLERLKEASSSTTGRIVSTDRWQHLSATVEYPVDGRLLQRSFEGVDLPVGATVNVYYQPEDVTNAALVPPETELGSRNKFVTTVSVFFATFIVLASAWLKKPFAHTGAERLWRRPRIAVPFVSFWILAGGVSRIVTTDLNKADWLSTAMIGVGTMFCLRGTFSGTPHLSWRDLVKRRIFLIGSALCIAAVIVTWARNGL